MAHLHTPSSLPLKTPVDHFRAKGARQKIHPREQVLLWVVSAQLVFLPWALGGMRAWSQWIALGMSVLAFFLSLLPRNYEAEGGQAPFRLYTWPKLLRFPIFWLGLVFLGYITTQALNPAWVFNTDGKVWWMRPVPNTEWLPSGVEVPFERWGPWRMLVIYSSVWLVGCASWIGFTRRRSLQTLFTVLAANAFLLALLGLAQRALESDKMFFLFKAPVYYFVSSFIYKNHAGAFFNLTLTLCVGLAWWHYARAERRLDKSSPSGVFAFFSTAVAMIVFLSYSRMATLLMAAALLVLITLFLWRHYFGVERERRNWWMLFLFAAVVVAFGRVGVGSVQADRVVQSIESLGRQGNFESTNFRFQAARATWDMAQERWVQGWGVGSWRFIFPNYQKKYPNIYLSDGKRLYWEHAHNDYLELLAEVGVIGCSVLLLPVGYAGFRAIRLRVWRNPLALCVLLGVGVTAVHSVIDFQFYNPAILTTWWVLLFATVRWVELEEIAGA